MSRLKGTGDERSLLWALFSPRGRIRGKTYVIGFFAVALFYVGIIFLLIGIYGDEDGRITDGPAILVALGLPVSLWCLLMLVWKRVQDIGYPGWVSIIAIAAFASFTPLSGFAPIALIFLAMWKGEVAVNAYGPPPVPRVDTPATNSTSKHRLRLRMDRETRERDWQEAKEKAERERKPKLGRQDRNER
ncbi:MAG: DUF805 domain-containing protein [Pseudomonadota bacterium]